MPCYSRSSPKLASAPRSSGTKTAPPPWDDADIGEGFELSGDLTLFDTQLVNRVRRRCNRAVRALCDSQLSALPYQPGERRGVMRGIWVSPRANRASGFLSGRGCNLLGHCPSASVGEAVRDQVGQLIHVPNTWYMEHSARWPRCWPSGHSGARASSATAGLRRMRPPSSWPASGTGALGSSRWR